MYDFRFGNQSQMVDNPEELLVFVKHLLPRWSNGIPDPECVGIFRAAIASNACGGVAVESGTGASTLALVLNAILNDGHVYSWDTNPSKGSFLRTVMTEAIAMPLGVNLSDSWTFVGMSASDPHLGFSILEELDQSISIAFLDSWHTTENLMMEVDLSTPLMTIGSVLSIDDAHYTALSSNYAFVNLQRAKLGLNSIDEPAENVGPTFAESVVASLRMRFRNVQELALLTDEDFKKDHHSAYFGTDRKIFSDFGMEDASSIRNRFKAWQIS